MSNISLKNIKVRERPLKVVVDAGNGVGGKVAPDLRQLGCEVVELYCDPTATFPSFPGPDGSGQSRGPDRHGGPARAPTWASPLTAMPTARRRCRRRQHHLGRPADDSLCPRHPRVQPRRHHHLRGEMPQALIEDIEAHGGKPLMWKTGHSSSRPRSARRRAAGRRDERPHLFCRSLLRLRRRHLRRLLTGGVYFPQGDKAFRTSRRHPPLLCHPRAAH